MAGYQKKRKYVKKRRFVRKRNGGASKYRNAIARVARPLNVKPRSAIQKVCYYNTFYCKPIINSSGDAGLKQQNQFITMNLNSIWPFNNGWNTVATSNGMTLSPNAPINAYSTPVSDDMTTMPNVRDGANLFAEYAQCCVTGAKVTIVGTPVETSTNNQLGYLYTVKHSQNNTGLTASSTISDLNKLPYRKLAKIQGTYNNPALNAKSAKIVVTHSVRKFNNVKDLRDNQNLFCHTGSNTQAHEPNEGDHLTVGIIPALNGRDIACTDYALQIRIEQSLLWTEPLENLSAGTGNYSFPRAARLGLQAAAAGALYLMN